MNALKSLHDTLTEEMREKIKEFGIIPVWIIWIVFAYLFADMGDITITRVFPPSQYIAWFAVGYSVLLIVRANRLHKENAPPLVPVTEEEKKEE